MWRRAAQLVSLALLLIIAATVAAPAAGAGTLISTTVRPADRGVPIAPHFTGLSYEYDQIFPAIGNAARVNEPYVRLLSHLTATGSGSPVLRVGSGASDASWWNPAGAPRPRGVSFDVKPDYFQALSHLRSATGSPLILGLNMAAGDPQIAVDLAREAQDRLGPHAIEAFEVGNEPDIYDMRPFADGFARPPDWSFDGYLADLHRFTAALSGVEPAPPLAAPGACCRPAWDEGLPRILKQEASHLALVTYHLYPRAGCYGTGADRDTSPASLLDDERVYDAVRRLLPLVAASRARKLPLRVSETNSSSCGWQHDGSSGTFAAALWAPDWLFALTATGVAGANLHASGAMNPIYASFTPDGRYFVQTPPLYYGLLLFARATADRARLVPGPTLRASTRAGARARVWVTRDRRRIVRVLVLAKSETQGGDAVIRMPGRGSARVAGLRAPGLTSTTGVTLGGQAVAERSFDGGLLGRPVSKRVRPRRGTYRFKVPPASAALLTVPPPS